jgi:hypothetical protein
MTDTQTVQVAPLGPCHLPHGEALRTFLEQPYVTASDLKAVLRKRGVFVHTPDKQHLIPLFVTTLLAPAEFKSLLESQSTKEDQPKRKTRTAEWTSTQTLAQAVPAVIDAGALINDEFANYRLIGSPTFRPVGNNHEHLILEYEIEREDLSKSWVQSITRHRGKIELKKVMDGKRAVMVLTHTAAETKEVSHRIAAFVTKHLRTNKDIDADAEPRRILFSSFSNETRIAFFWSLTGLQKDSVLTFKAINDFDLLPTSEAKLPAKLKWMQDRVTKLKVKGDQLHDTFFITESEVHPFLLFSRMEAKFDFKYHAASGECTIVYEFAGFAPDKSGEFEFEAHISHLGPDPEFSHVDKAAVKEFLQDTVDQFVLDCFERICPVGGTTPAEPTPPKTANGAADVVLPLVFADSGKPSKQSVRVRKRV